MSNHFKKYFYLFILLFIILLLTSCGNGKIGAQNTGQQSDNNQIYLSVSSVCDSFVFVNTTAQLKPVINYNGTNQLNYTINSSADFVSFDSSAQTFIFSPENSDTGEWAIKITVKDTINNLEASETFKIDIFDTNVYYNSNTDWRNRIVYFIMIDRFSDGDSNNNDDNGTYDPDDKYKIHGGDIQGLINKFDYIKNLGVNAVWLTPVMKNYDSYHGYAVQNFKAVDPHFGTMEKLREFIDLAHQNGIAVILDIICNHSANLISSTSGDYNFNPSGYTLQYNNSNIKHEPDYLANPDYFHNYGEISDWNDEYQVKFGDFPGGLDDFKTENPAVQNILSYIYAWWILKTDCDGFRIDTVKHVDFEFWEYFLPYIKNIAAKIGKPDFFIFGETWYDDDYKVAQYSGAIHNPQVYLFESLTHFPLYYTINQVFREQSAPDLLSDRLNNLSYYDVTSHDRLITFLDNHDLPRFLKAGSGAQYYPNLKLAYIFISTFYGIPVLYYGTEQGFDGGSDPWNREDMWDGLDWGPSVGDNFNQDHELYLFIKKVNEKLKSYPFIKQSDLAELHAASSAGIYAFSRYDNDSEAVIILNNSNSAQTAELTLKLNYSDGTILTNLFNTNDTLTITNNQISIQIPALSYKIYIH